MRKSVKRCARATAAQSRASCNEIHVGVASTMIGLCQRWRGACVQSQILSQILGRGCKHSFHHRCEVCRQIRFMLVLDMYAKDACIMHSRSSAIVKLCIVLWLAIQTGNAVRKQSPCPARACGRVTKPYTAEHGLHKQAIPRRIM